MVQQLKSNPWRRRLRTRAKIKKTNPKALRLSVFRSNKHIYSQIIDVFAGGKVLVSANELEIKEKKGKKSEQAGQVGQLLAQKALKKKIKTVVFDKSSYSFKGRVKALAEGARKEGLQF
jgi:large subunit ribosomal protein L18